ncbi:MAG: serine/threonine protein kinase [Planctomycetota bacterium]|nr:MAG: serine/threonine protein kinase [Planctomycetota bacterium]
MAVDIPNYRIVEKLGVGAESRIFRARCMRTGKDYTVKIVKVVKPEDANFVELLRNEYAIGSNIDHPVIRKVYDLRLMRQRLRVRGAILFMEYVDGISLAHKEFDRPLVDVLRIFAESARGLDAMHRAGFVHADLKPNNIMVTSDGQVKLIDLGQSARIHEAKARIQGTIDYIAPEQISRDVLDQRTDVFGLGATLYRVLTGRAVRTGMNQTISIHAQGLVGRRLDEIHEAPGPDLPPVVVRLIEDCCRPNPDDRIPDMTRFIERVQLALTTIDRQIARLRDAAERQPGEDEEDSALEQAPDPSAGEN